MVQPVPTCANVPACLQVVGSTEASGNQKWQLAHSTTDAEKAFQPESKHHEPSSDITTKTSQSNTGLTSSAANGVTAASAQPAASGAPNLDTKSTVESAVVEGVAACTARLAAFADLCGSSNRDKLQAFVQAIFDHQKVMSPSSAFLLWVLYSVC